jgi:hypothetical protein
MTNADLLYFDPLGMGGENRYETEKGEVERYAKDYLDIDTGRAGALGDSLGKAGVDISMGTLELMARLAFLPVTPIFIALSEQSETAHAISNNQLEYFVGVGQGLVETFNSPQNFVASFGLAFSEQEQAVLAEAWGKGDAEAIKAIIANKDSRLLISVATVAGGKVVVGAVKKPVVGEIASSSAAKGGAAALGELKPLTAEQIIAINKTTGGGGVTLTGSVDTVLANMSYREGFSSQAATAIRDIAGSHLFQDGNKRTAQAVVEAFAKQNGIKVDSQALRTVIDEVGKGSLGKYSAVESIDYALKSTVIK